METLKALILYFEAVFQDGDYLNDWLTHLPTWAQDYVSLVGHTISFFLF